MQYMKLGEVRRQELMEALAGMKHFLRETFGSLAAEETRTPGPGGSAKIALQRNYRALPLSEGLRAFEAAREANLRR